MNTTLPFALAAARRGWHVFPLRPGSKKPVGKFIAWECHATTDADRIRAFWSTGPFNVAIACGPSGLIVIDLDMPKPDQTAPTEWDMPGVHEGADVLAVLCEHHGQPFPNHTFTVRTRRGGTHLYFAPPPGVELRNTNGSQRSALGWLIDTRAHGGYVVGPGSYVNLPDGTGPYEVVNDLPVAPLPDWLAGLLTQTKHAAPPMQCSSGLNGRVSDLDAYTKAALHGEMARVSTAVTGGRNHALYTAAFNLGRLVGAHALTEDLATTALYDAASTHFSPGTDGFSPTEATAAIRSGLRSGIAKPRILNRRETAA